MYADSEAIFKERATAAAAAAAAAATVAASDSADGGLTIGEWRARAEAAERCVSEAEGELASLRTQLTQAQEASSAFETRALAAEAALSRHGLHVDGSHKHALKLKGKDWKRAGTSALVESTLATPPSSSGSHGSSTPRAGRTLAALAGLLHVTRGPGRTALSHKDLLKAAHGRSAKNEAETSASSGKRAVSHRNLLGGFGGGARATPLHTTEGRPKSEADARAPPPKPVMLSEARTDNFSSSMVNDAFSS
jgi:hypothetical protein